MADFPKWVPDSGLGCDVLVDSPEEAQAVADGRAIYHTIKSAQGDTIEVVGVTPKLGVIKTLLKKSGIKI